MSQTILKQKVALHIDIIIPWDYSTIYWNFSVAFFVQTAHGCQIQMCHQNYSKLSGTFYTGETLILYMTNIRFRVPPGSNLNLSLMTVQSQFVRVSMLELVRQSQYIRVSTLELVHQSQYIRVSTLELVRQSQYVRVSMLELVCQSQYIRVSTLELVRQSQYVIVSTLDFFKLGKLTD